MDRVGDDSDGWSDPYTFGLSDCLSLLY